MPASRPRTAASRAATGDYSDRSGLPRGAQASRGLARKDFEIPPDYRAEGTVADAASRSSRPDGSRLQARRRP